MGDIFGYNDHDFSLVSINCYSHLGVVFMKNMEMFVNIIMNFFMKNNIINIEEKNNENTSKLGCLAPRRFQILL